MSRLSIITATYNAMEHLPNLVQSLRDQQDKEFEWVVADGASTDGTLELLYSVTDLNVKIISQEDFGIYDALNRGIKASTSEYYLVIGADDILYPNAVKDFKEAIADDVEIVTATIDFGDRLSKPRGRSSWFYGQFAYISGHAVGSVFKKSLHEKNGYYSRMFPIAADQLFILKSAVGGARIRVISSVVGKHNLIGVSAADGLGTITEWYRVQISVGYNKYIQTLLFILRIVRYIARFN